MKRSLLGLVAIIILFSSCRLQRAQRTIYASQAANVTYFKQKGDAKFTAYYSGDNAKSSGYNLQTGYAISNHFAVMAAFTHKQEHRQYEYDSIRFYQSFFQSVVETNIYDSSFIRYRRNNIEIGLGYFIPVDKQKNIIFNLYPGVSLGKFKMQDAGLDSTGKNYTRFYHSNAIKYFLQNSFNCFPADFIHFSLGIKFSLLAFNFVNTSYASSELSYFYLDKIDHKAFFLYEPFFNIQVALPKYPRIKLDGQINSCSRLKNGYPGVRNFNASVGLTIEINKYSTSTHGK